MTELVTMMLVFLATGIGFLVVNLFVGKLIRPSRWNEEKGTIYECGESPVGSSWIQFDLRFYVVALLFVIFDVEMAFFFPWAVVFGSANQLAKGDLNAEQRSAIVQSIQPTSGEASTQAIAEQQEAAHMLAQLAFIDVLVFFGVLLVGFAYLWRRGDLEWVRGMAGQTAPEPNEVPATGGA